jgi:hypothetical protein
MWLRASEPVDGDVVRSAAVTDADGVVPAALLQRALGFGLGQALVAGPISPVPLLAQIGTRHTPEGGGDVPTTWTTRRDTRPLEDGSAAAGEAQTPDASSHTARPRRSTPVA